MEENGTYVMTPGVPDTFLIISMTGFCMMSIGGNLVVGFTVLASRKLRNVTSVFLLNLTLCDFLVGVIMMPLAIDGVLNGHWAGSEVSWISSKVIYT